MRKSKSKTQAVVDLGTSPHGLSVGLRDTSQETRCPESLLSLADAFAVRGNGLPPGGSAGSFSATLSSDGGRASGQPESASKAARAKRLPFHYLELTDCEYLHLRSAVEHSRDRDRKAIRKGMAVPEDLQATDTLWHKLQEVMALRLKDSRS